MTFLELKNVYKSFPGSRNPIAVLRDVNLGVARGEFVAILGPSGAGKTTLISLIAGLNRPDSGTIVLGEKEVVEPGSDCGVVFQNYSLLPWLSARENVELAVSQVFPHDSRRQRRERADEQLRRVNLAAAGQKRPGELSGGMRQRVAIARALAVNPQLLLLDEPLSALDALNRATLQDEIAQLWQEQAKTVLLITNDVDEAILLADRVIPLRCGPGPSLGEAIPIDLPRPRIRKGLNSTPRFQELRARVIKALLDCQPRRDKSFGAVDGSAAVGASAGGAARDLSRRAVLLEAAP